MNLKLCSVMCAPLMAQGELLGILYVGNDNVVNLFEESSLDVLSIFAGQASLILQNAMLRRQHQERLRRPQAAARATSASATSSAPAPRCIEVFRKVEKVAGADISVLITGETGTGKELIARAMHQGSQRKDGPFHRRQLRRDPREPDRERAVRPRARRVHGRGRDAAGQVPAGGRRHAVPRRGGRAAACAAGEAAARAAGASRDEGRATPSPSTSTSASSPRPTATSKPR